MSSNGDCLPVHSEMQIESRPHAMHYQIEGALFWEETCITHRGIDAELQCIIRPDLAESGGASISIAVGVGFPIIFIEHERVVRPSKAMHIQRGGILHPLGI